VNSSSTLWFCPPVPKIQWVGSWLCKFPTHNTTCTYMMTSDEIIEIQMKGRKLFIFDKEQLYWIFFIIFQDPIVGNGQKSGMLSCEPVSVNANKWAQVNLFRNILLTSMQFFLTHGMEHSMMWRNILSRGHGWMIFLMIKMDKLL
jgi:hypothetical protein